jgi:hypothetical protein
MSNFRTTRNARFHSARVNLAVRKWDALFRFRNFRPKRVRLNFNPSATPTSFIRRGDGHNIVEDYSYADKLKPTPVEPDNVHRQSKHQERHPGPSRR